METASLSTGSGWKALCRYSLANRGFSLVEILVVITIMALLVTLVAGFATNLLDNARVTACQSNLKEIGQHMVLMKEQRKARKMKGWPQYKGIRFLLELTKGGKGGKFALVSGKKTQMFLCPGTDDINTTEEDRTEGSAYFDLDNLDTFSISYAGRNQTDYPVDRDPAGDDAVLASDDNEGRPNHKFHTNYVTVGLAVDSVHIQDYLDDYPELEFLPVGPDSPEPMFQKLLFDY